jgi:uncharacterized protein DUF5330
MVNGGFPLTHRYGFELVDTAGCSRSRPSIENLPGESDAADFSRNFGELSPLQSLAIYREWLGETGCAHPRNPPRRDDRNRKMFFLLRMCFWLGLVLVLLPRDKMPDSEKLPQISVSDAVTAATAAVSDMGQFCKRQPQACEVGGQAATVIGVRAQDGARKIYHSVTDKKADEKKPDDKKSEADKKSSDHTGSIGVADIDEPSLVNAVPHDTLTSDDLAADWRLPPTP